MINFRYHLVSLIAVFLALAIGVVLGAGPLQARIARTVQTPASAVAQAESQALQDARYQAELDGKGVTAIAQAITPNFLQGANVVTVALPGTDSADVTSVRDSLTRAGAKLAGAVSLTENWDLQGMEEYRHTLANPLSSRMSNIPKDATPDDVLGYAIVQVLTSNGAERDIAAEILTDEKTPIMTYEEDPRGEAHAIVVIGPRKTAQNLISDDEHAVLRSVASWNGLARAIATAPKSGVVIGDAQLPDSMLSQIRALKVPVTTIDQVGTQSANLSLVVALPSATAQERAFGFGEGATSVFPPLPKID